MSLPNVGAQDACSSWPRLETNFFNSVKHFFWNLALVSSRVDCWYGSCGVGKAVSLEVPGRVRVALVEAVVVVLERPS